MEHVKQYPGIAVRLCLRVFWRGRPPDMIGSCEYSEKALAGSRHVVVLHRRFWRKGKNLITVKSQLVYGMSNRASELMRSFEVCNCNEYSIFIKGNNFLIN
jgi:hypothetical protein